MRIAHFADLHIGYSHLNKRAKDGRNQRLVDFEEAALALAKKAVEEEVDLVVVAGDFFHRINMYPSALSGALLFTNILKEIPIVVIGGNHDEAEAEGQYSGLRFLSDHSQIHLFLEQDYFDFKEVRLHLAGYRVLSRAEKETAQLKDFQFSDSANNILVAHGYTSKQENDILKDSEVLIPESWFSNPKFDLFLLGHIHKQGEVRDKAFYAGSIERRNFGEVNERPGFYIHDLGKEIKSTPVYLDQVSNTLPRPMLDFYFDLQDKDVDSLDREVVEIINNSKKGSMIRLVLENTPTSLDKKQYRSKWESLARKSGCLSFETTVRSKQMSQLMDIKFESPPTDVSAGLIKYIKEQKIEDENKQAVLSLTKEIIHEATEKVMATEEE
jgi:DNA repair exonuclease SbcCD nuclease subunit